MSDWTKVVTHPLGLAGFALFLVFGYLAKVKSKDERRWLSQSAVALALVALAGGLILAYNQMPRPTATPSGQVSNPPAQQQRNQVQQTTTGPGSPAVQGVQGDVTITVDQSSGEARPRKPTNKEPAKTQLQKLNEKEPDQTNK